MKKLILPLLILISSFGYSQICNRLLPAQVPNQPNKALNFMYCDPGGVITNKIYTAAIDSVKFGGFHVVTGLKDSLNDRFTKTQANIRFLQTELDPLVPSFVKSITSTNISNWNTAHSWGDHSLVGYLLPSNLTPYSTTSQNNLLYKDINYVAPSPTLAINGNTLFTIGNNSVTLPAQITQTIIGLGIATVTQTPNSFSITATEVDGSITNEIQSLSLVSGSLSLSGSNSVLLPTYSPSLGLSGYSLSINGGNTVLIPSNTLTAISAGSNIAITNGSVITNSAPDRTVSITVVGQGTVSGTYPNFTVTMPRQEKYSGTTNAAGLYTVTYPTAFSNVPNVQFQIVGGNNKQTVLLTSSTTTGFTLYVQLRVDVLGVLPSYSNVSGQSVKVLVTEE